MQQKWRAWSEVPVSRASLPTSQTGQAGRQEALPSSLPFLSQMSVILTENKHDVWGWVKIIAVWFEKLFLIVYLLFIAYLWKLWRSSLREVFKTIEFSGYRIKYLPIGSVRGLSLLKESQREYGQYMDPGSLDHCCWCSYKNPLHRNNCSPPLPW